ncbi:MAG: hypothetical protein JOZ48_04620 [Acidobacteriaceae bacterium]|nr:hypothetical protein [Acidobacteriaceae bacterium]
MTRISIDPNIRVRGNGTVAGFEDVDGYLLVGLDVEIYEEEADIVGRGKVTEIDVDRQLVFLSIDWGSLQDASTVSRTENLPAPAAPEQISVSSPRLAKSGWIAATLKFCDRLRLEQPGVTPFGNHLEVIT